MIASALLGRADRGSGCVRLQRAFPSSPGQLWRALTEPAEVAAWLGRVEEGGPGRPAASPSATALADFWDPYDLLVQRYAAAAK